MCRWGTDVLMKVGLRQDGKIRKKIIAVDQCIAPIVRALNKSGIETVASCCGHGKHLGDIMLADGRELLIAPDFAVARRISETLIPQSGKEGTMKMTGPPRPPPAFPDRPRTEGGIPNIPEVPPIPPEKTEVRAAPLCPLRSIIQNNYHKASTISRYVSRIDTFLRGSTRLPAYADRPPLSVQEELERTGTILLSALECLRSIAAEFADHSKEMVRSADSGE